MEIIINMIAIVVAIVGWVVLGFVLIFYRRKGERVIYLQSELEKTKKELEETEEALEERRKMKNA